jgi:hypothetical protein
MKVIATLLGMVSFGGLVWSIAGPITGNLPQPQAADLMVWSLVGLGVALVLDVIARFLRAAERKAGKD